MSNVYLLGVTQGNGVWSRFMISPFRLLCLTTKLELFSEMLVFPFWGNCFESSTFPFVPFTFLIPMDTSSSIRHRFDVEIRHGKFVKISSILKSNYMWKLWHQFNVMISTWFWLLKSTKYRLVLHVDFSMSFRHQTDETAVLLFPFYHFLIFSALGAYSELIWYSSELM